MSKASEIREMYAELPAMECKGLCSDSCGPIEMTRTEAKAIAKRTRRQIQPCDGDLTCKLLTPAGWCSVYSDRPAICRLWGIAETMACPHGCVPEGGHWPTARGFAWLHRIYEIDGDGDVETAFAKSIDTRPAEFRVMQRMAMAQHIESGGSLVDWLEANRPT